MTKLIPSKKIFASESLIHNAGRGVFASETIKKGHVIEQCPVIVIPKDQTKMIESTLLVNYSFLWGSDLTSTVIALGFGSLYNHSYHPNATYMKDPKNKVIDFVALREIKEGEEITVNYNFGNPSDTSPLNKLGVTDIPPFSESRIEND